MSDPVDLLIAMGTSERVRPSPVGHDVLERALAACLAALAEVASASGQPERAARLSAAVEVLGTSSGVAGATIATTAREPGVLLTAREHEVARLVARGLTNRGIAEALVISERTVDTHVQNILRKLDLSTRAQVAVWAINGHAEVPARDHVEVTSAAMVRLR